MQVESSCQDSSKLSEKVKHNPQDAVSAELLPGSFRMCVVKSHDYLDRPGVDSRRFFRSCLNSRRV